MSIAEAFSISLFANACGHLSRSWSVDVPKISRLILCEVVGRIRKRSTKQLKSRISIFSGVYTKMIIA